MRFGPTIRVCQRHRMVESKWLSKRGWNVSTYCAECAEVRYWYVITEDNRQVALSPSGVAFSDRPAL